MKKIQIGILGLGNIAIKIYLPKLQQIENISVLAICDTIPEKAQKLAQENQIPYYFNNPQDLFRLPELDAVIICTPNYTHFSLVTQALIANKHVICEKPLTVNSQEAQKILELARKQNKTVLVSLTNRFRPEVVKLRSLIEEETLGDIYSFKIGWLRRRGIPGVGSWFTSKHQAGGGVLVDLGSHLLDLVLWLLPSIASQSVTVFSSLHSHFISQADASASWYGKPTGDCSSSTDVEDTAIVKLVTQSGMSISLEAAWATNEISQDITYITAIGTKGKAQVNTLFGFSDRGVRSTQPLTIYQDDNQKPETPTILGANDAFLPYLLQLETFCELLTYDNCNLTMAESSWRSATLIEAIYTAAENNASVKVNLSQSKIN